MDIDEGSARPAPPTPPNEHASTPPIDRFSTNHLDLDTLSRTIVEIMKTIEELKLQQNGHRPKTRPLTVDEDIFARPANGHSRRRKRGNVYNHFRELVRQHARGRLEIDVKGDITKWPSPLGHLASGYNDGSTNIGPTQETCMLDWNCPGLTTWSKDCIVILTHDFLGQHQDGAFPTLREDVGVLNVSAALRDYLMHLKTRYSKVLRDPVNAEIAKKLAEKRSRSLNRRQQLLKRRLTLLQHHDFPEESIEMVQELDIDGMSSEESEGEIGTERQFQIKKLQWRNQDLTSWLQRVDAMPHKNCNNESLMSVRYRRKRVASDLDTDRRGPISGLPRNLYRQEWLAVQSSRALRRLGATEETFVLPKIDSFVPKC